MVKLLKNSFIEMNQELKIKIITSFTQCQRLILQILKQIIITIIVSKLILQDFDGIKVLWYCNYVDVIRMPILIVQIILVEEVGSQVGFQEMEVLEEEEILEEGEILEEEIAVVAQEIDLGKILTEIHLQISQ